VEAWGGRGGTITRNVGVEGALHVSSTRHVLHSQGSITEVSTPSRPQRGQKPDAVRHLRFAGREGNYNSLFARSLWGGEIESLVEARTIENVLHVGELVSNVSGWLTAPLNT